MGKSCKDMDGRKMGGDGRRMMIGVGFEVVGAEQGGTVEVGGWVLALGFLLRREGELLFVSSVGSISSMRVGLD